MIIRLKSKVKRGNSSGTGFAKLTSKKSKINLGDRVKVSFFINDSTLFFFAKIIKMDGMLGVYIPSNLAKKYGLLGKTITLEVEKIAGFGTKAGKDGRVYIPIEYGKKFSLETNDIVSADIILNRDKQTCLLKIIKRKRNNKIEFMAFPNPSYPSKDLQVILKNKLSKSIRPTAGSIDLKKILGNTLSQINENELAIFDGKKKSVVILADISYEEIALYIGAYFADGTRKGNSWGICASTPEQAKFYLKMHSMLIRDASPVFELSFTILHGKVDSARLIKEWQTATDVDLSKIKIRTHKSLSGSARKYNDFGTLVIKEHRLAVLRFYNKILFSLINRITRTKNKELAMNFICGVLEGDGAVNAKKRAHIQVATNRNDCPILERILAVSGLRFKAVKEGDNKFYIRIGALEIIRNLPLLENKIFVFYPKRRRRLFSRLAAVGGVKFLIGTQPSAASWVKSSFKKMGLVDKKYKLTSLGKKVKSSIIVNMEAQKSVTVE
ncbi:MAG: hypothetical protein NTX79_00230 [Candidatus Micrarchaeota archaeon]|nr:hypothetical protein [Candidatus Micrarchaeota archaeon]